MVSLDIPQWFSRRISEASTVCKQLQGTLHSPPEEFQPRESTRSGFGFKNTYSNNPRIFIVRIPCWITDRNKNSSIYHKDCMNSIQHHPTPQQKTRLYAIGAFVCVCAVDLMIS